MLMFGKPNRPNCYLWFLLGQPLLPLLYFSTRVFPFCTTPLARVFYPVLASRACLIWGSFDLCSSAGTVTVQWEDKQAIISCFCYWTHVISSDSDIWLGALIFIHSTSIVLFLIRNLSNRRVHLRTTRKNSSFHNSLPAFPLPPVLQQLRSCFQLVQAPGRTRVSLPVSSWSLSEGLH